MNSKLRLVAIWLILPVLFSCALRQAPPGGPEDKTPPGIVEMTPKSGGTNISPDTKFTIIFSKSMDHTQTENAIFLSPVFWDYPTINWSGKKMTFTPPQNLRSNCTYILTIGAGAVDEHGNRLGKSHSFAFSTGAQIDSGSISGSVYSISASRPVYDIWAYSLNDTSGMRFWTRIPDYATQVDSLGNFSISYLGKSKYMVIAIDDKNDDLFWEPESEPLGLPPFLISLDSNNVQNEIVFVPEQRDTLLAAFSRVSTINNQRISVEFSQPIALIESLSVNSFKLITIDTLAEKIAIRGAYPGAEKQYILETDQQTGNQAYRLIANNIHSIWGIPFDTIGTRFTGAAFPDTVGPSLLITVPSKGSENTFQDSVIELGFDERIKPLNFGQAVSVIADSTDTLKFLPYWIYPNYVRLRITGRLPHSKTIHVVLEPKNIFDASSNPMPDSALSYNFKLVPMDTLGEVTALVYPESHYQLYGYLTGQAKGGPTYKSRGDKTGKIHFNAVMPGTYKFHFFEDSDSNGIWTPGVIEPFKPAERLSFVPDTVKVRSRWTTDIGSASLPSPNSR